MNTFQTAVALVVAAASASAQARPQQPKTSPQYFVGTISPDVAKLPPYFAGHDIESLVKKLLVSREAKAKSEFETTEEYQARLKGAQDSGLLAFVLPVGEDDGGAVLFKYDADSKSMTVELWGVLPWLLHPAEADEHPPFQIVVKRRLLASGRYAAANSFGAKAVVERKEYNEYGLALAGGLVRSEWPKYSWPMEVSAAKESKQNLRAAVLCTREGAKVYESEGHGEPTIQSPLEFVWHYRYLPVTIQALLVFDAKSGKIVQRFSRE